MKAGEGQLIARNQGANQFKDLLVILNSKGSWNTEREWENPIVNKFLFNKAKEIPKGAPILGPIGDLPPIHGRKVGYSERLNLVIEHLQSNVEHLQKDVGAAVGSGAAVLIQPHEKKTECHDVHSGGSHTSENIREALSSGKRKPEDSEGQSEVMSMRTGVSVSPAYPSGSPHVQAPINPAQSLGIGLSGGFPGGVAETIQNKVLAMVEVTYGAPTRPLLNLLLSLSAPTSSLPQFHPLSTTGSTPIHFPHPQALSSSNVGIHNTFLQQHQQLQMLKQEQLEQFHQCQQQEQSQQNKKAQDSTNEQEQDQLHHQEEE